MLPPPTSSLVYLRSPSFKSVLCYSRDPADAAACPFFTHGRSASRELDRVAGIIFHAKIPFPQALHVFATEENMFEGQIPQRVSSEIKHDLLVAFRVLRLWAETGEQAESLGILHVFSPRTWYVLLRMITFIYNQERRHAENDDAVFLQQELIFGPGAADRNCSISEILYQMYYICYAYADGTAVSRCGNLENEDDSAERLSRLTDEHRRRRGIAEENPYYYADDSDDNVNTYKTGEETLFHISPLHQVDMKDDLSSGPMRPLRTRGWQNLEIPEFSGDTLSSVSYLRDSTLVTANVSGNVLYMSESRIPQQFFRDHNALGALSYENGVESENQWGRAEVLIRDANEGIFPAAKFLLSQIFSGDLWFSSGPKTAWCVDTSDDYETVEEYLNIGPVTDVVGLPLQSQSGEIFLPFAVQGRVCYLTRDSDGDASVTWRRTNDLKVVARRYNGFSKSARLV